MTKPARKWKLGLSAVTRTDLCECRFSDDTRGRFSDDSGWRSTWDPRPYRAFKVSTRALKPLRWPICRGCIALSLSTDLLLSKLSHSRITTTKLSRITLRRPANQPIIRPAFLAISSVQTGRSDSEKGRTVGIEL